MTNPNKKVAIAVVFFNSAKKLADLFVSLQQQNYSSELIEYIFVDNNSNDGSIDLAKKYFPEAHCVINSENLGFATANNQAYELAKNLNAEYLSLLNDDVIVTPDWLVKLIDIAEENEKVAAVQAKLMLWPEHELINSYGNAITFLGFAYCNNYREKDKVGVVPFAVPYVSGGACVIKMNALEKIGLFDDKLFMYHEDVDLGWRLRLLGYELLLAPDAVVYHKYSYSKAKYKYYYLERNRQFVALKNFKLASLILFLPAYKVMEWGMLFYSARNGWLKEKVIGWFWLIGNWRYIISERKKIQKLRIVGDREILKLFCAGIKSEAIDSPVLVKYVNPALEWYFKLAQKVIRW